MAGRRSIIATLIVASIYLLALRSTRAETTWWQDYNHYDANATTFTEFVQSVPAYEPPAGEWNNIAFTMEATFNNCTFFAGEGAPAAMRVLLAYYLNLTHEVSRFNVVEMTCLKSQLYAKVEVNYKPQTEAKELELVNLTASSIPLLPPKMVNELNCTWGVRFYEFIVKPIWWPSTWWDALRQWTQYPGLGSSREGVTEAQAVTLFHDFETPHDAVSYAVIAIKFNTPDCGAFMQLINTVGRSAPAALRAVMAAALDITVNMTTVELGHVTCNADPDYQVAWLYVNWFITPDMSDNALSYLSHAQSVQSTTTSFSSMMLSYYLLAKNISVYSNSMQIYTWEHRRPYNSTFLSWWQPFNHYDTLPFKTTPTNSYVAFLQSIPAYASPPPSTHPANRTTFNISADVSDCTFFTDSDIGPAVRVLVADYLGIADEVSRLRELVRCRDHHLTIQMLLNYGPELGAGETLVVSAAARQYIPLFRADLLDQLHFQLTTPLIVMPVEWTTSWWEALGQWLPQRWPGLQQGTTKEQALALFTDFNAPADAFQVVPFQASFSTPDCTALMQLVSEKPAEIQAAARAFFASALSLKGAVQVDITSVNLTEVTCSSNQAVFQFFWHETPALKEVQATYFDNFIEPFTFPPDAPLLTAMLAYYLMEDNITIHAQTMSVTMDGPDPPVPTTSVPFILTMVATDASLVDNQTFIGQLKDHLATYFNTTSDHINMTVTVASDTRRLLTIGTTIIIQGYVTGVPDWTAAAVQSAAAGSAMGTALSTSFLNGFGITSAMFVTITPSPSPSPSPTLASSNITAHWVNVVAAAVCGLMAMLAW